MFDILYIDKSNNQQGRAFAPFQTQWYISGRNTATKYQRLPRVLSLVIDLSNKITNYRRTEHDTTGSGDVVELCEFEAA